MTIIKTIFQNPRFGFYKKNDGKIHPNLGFLDSYFYNNNNKIIYL